MWHLGTVADAEHCQLDAVGAEGLDVSVVHEADAPHVDHPQVGGGLTSDQWMIHTHPDT